MESGLSIYTGKPILGWFSSLLPASYRGESHKTQMQLFLQKLKAVCVLDKNPVPGLLFAKTNSTLLPAEGFPENLHSFFIIINENVD